MSEIVHLPLRKIIRDPRCQPRVTPLDAEHVEEMREAKANGATFPPVVVYEEKHSPTRTDYYLSEGFHRFEVFDLDAEETIPCVIRDGSLEDAIVNAMASNAAHGLKRTRGDLKKAIETMLEMCADWSDRRIAEHCRCSFSYVSLVHRDRDEAEGVHNAHPEQHTPTPVVKKGKDGVEREYTKPAKEAPKVKEFKEIAKEAEEAAKVKHEGPAAPAGFDMREWTKSFGTVVRLMAVAANRAAMMNGPEHRTAMLAADTVQKFITQTLSKPQK